MPRVRAPHTPPPACRNLLPNLPSLQPGSCSQLASAGLAASSGEDAPMSWPGVWDPGHPPLSRPPLTCLHPHSSTLWDSQRSPRCDCSSDTRSCIISSPAHLSRPPRAASPLGYFHSSCKTQPRRLLTEKHVLTQHGACHTRTTIHVSALKIRLCLP